MRDPKRVMVVHGRNERARNAVFAFLRTLGLSPIEWEEAVAVTGLGSPHNLEAVRAAMESAQAVVVVFTAEDLACLLEPLATPYDVEDLALRGQPRQNVLIEAGMAMGIDHRRTVLVELGPIRRASDLDGLNTVRLSNDPARRTALRSRLETAGCHMTSHTADWLSTELGGNFEIAPIPWTPEKPVAESPPSAPVPARPADDPPAARDSSRIPGHVSLVSLLDADLTVPGVASRWAAAGDDLSLVVGADAAGPVALGLTTHGPHGLIAGTTGSGKSELVRSIIAGLALRYPPTAVNFLLLDHKGGAAFGACSRLPHAAQMVTDLGDRLGRRLLVSLNAELARREALLRSADVRDHRELLRRRPDDAPASLVIFIDELASLMAELPEVVDGIVDVAQRGRSLGVFLVAATQRPGAVLTAALRANVSFTIALRQVSAAESRDVIGSPEAEAIPRQLPGRAFLRTGYDELTVFQSAYVGDTPRAGGHRTELEAIVDACRAAARETDLPAVRPVVLAPLPRVVPLSGLPVEAQGRAAVGLIDEPRLQQQGPYVLDFETTGGVVVLGAPGSGKTTALRTIATSLARGATTSELQLYGADYGGGGLASLERLPHCGSIVDGSDDERIDELLEFLRREADRRHHLTLRGEEAAGFPRILVLVDSYAGLVAKSDRAWNRDLIDGFPRLISDGRHVNMSFAISADRRAGVTPAVLAALPERVVLRLPDPDDYLTLGLTGVTAAPADLPPGRGFVEGGNEMQCAVVDDGLEVGAQAAPVPPISTLALRVDWPAPPAAAATLSSAIGIANDTRAPAWVDLSTEHFAVIGHYRSGRTTALATLVRGLVRDTGVRVVVLNPRRSHLRAVDGPIHRTAEGPEACEALVADLVEEVAAPSLAESGEPTVVVVIDDAGELDDARMAGALERLVGLGRDRPVRIIAAFETTEARGFAPWIRKLLRDGHGLLLEPNADMDGEVLRTRLPRRPIARTPGRGYLCERGRVTLIQTAVVE